MSDIACQKGPFMSTSECEASIGTSLSAIKSDSIQGPPSGEGLRSMDIMSKDAHSSSSDLLSNRSKVQANLDS